MDGSLSAARFARIIGVACLWVACSVPRSFVLMEGVNAKVDRTPVSVRQVAVKQEWRSGKRVTIRYATLLVHEAKAKEIQRHLVSEGDGLIIDGVEYTVVAVEPGAEDARAKVTLQKRDD